MAENNKKLHNGHRQRVREKFISEGNLDNFAPHNVLEFLLFYSIPRADTNELAHRLIEEFGSLKGVFDAPLEALTQIDGIGENSATLIKLVPALSRTYEQLQANDIKRIYSTQDAVNFLKPKFIGLKNEILIMICMNKSGKILNCSQISTGGIDYTQVDVRKILKIILNCHATEVIIAHNHPNGLCIPSKGDSDMTEMLANALSNIGTTLRNHIIISENDYFSFAENHQTVHHLKLNSNNFFIVNEDSEE